MSDPGSLIPISDEQAKAIQDVLKILKGMGGFLKETVGTVPEDLVGILVGDWLKVRRAENLVRMLRKSARTFGRTKNRDRASKHIDCSAPHDRRCRRRSG